VNPYKDCDNGSQNTNPTVIRLLNKTEVDCIACMQGSKKGIQKVGAEPGIKVRLENCDINGQLLLACIKK
jgi:hypothetical protein